MADEAQPVLAEHEGTYRRFTGLIKYSAIGGFIIAFLIVLINANGARKGGGG